MIEIKNVSKTYNGTKKALDNVNLKIASGEIFAFIGHNGAGKTTMIKSIVGILDFEEGDITIYGKSIKEDPIGCKLDMAYVPDNPDLYENMKAIDFINFVCDMYDDPKVLIMDEPFVGLDPQAVYDMKELMKSMAKEGKTIFFSTHILDVAEKLCDHVAIIKSGKIVKSGKMKDIKGDESLEKVFLELGDRKWKSFSHY